MTRADMDVEAINKTSELAERLVGKPYMYDYLIDKQMAEKIIRVDAPAKLKSYDLNYTLAEVGYDMYVVAMLPKTNIVDFVVKLEKSSSEAPAVPMNLEASLELMKDTTAEYKQIRKKVFFGLAFLIGAAVALLTVFI